MSTVLKNFLAACDVLPSNVKVSPQIRLTSYAAALMGEGLTKSDLDEILTRGFKTWKFYPSPAEILEVMRDIRAEKYEAMMKDSIGIPGPDGRLRIVANDSPEAIAYLEAQATPELPEPTSFETAQRRIRDTVAKFDESFELPVKRIMSEPPQLVDDPEGEENARATLEAQKAELMGGGIE